MSIEDATFITGRTFDRTGDMIQSNNNYILDSRCAGCSRTAIRSQVRRYAEIGSANDRPRPGRKNRTTLEQNRYI